MNNYLLKRDSTTEDTYNLFFDGEEYLRLEELGENVSVSFNPKSSTIIEYDDLEEIKDRYKLIDISDELNKDKYRDLTKWNKKYSNIFKYYIVYNLKREELVFSFVSGVKGSWASDINNNVIPDDWKIQSISEDINLLTFNASMKMALQYGRNEKITNRLSDFKHVEFCKTLSDINWNGLRLTNPITKEVELFEPKDLHLTSIESLYNKIGDSVTDDFIKGYLESTVVD